MGDWHFGSLLEFVNLLWSRVQELFAVVPAYRFDQVSEDDAN